jgi:hypothetical protein
MSKPFPYGRFSSDNLSPLFGDRQGPEKRAKFLGALKDTCNVTRACEISDLGRASAYEWRAEDASFAEEWNRAIEIAADLLEDEAVRRAKDGTDRPVYQGGQLVAHVREYSDTLLIFPLKCAKPKKYREKLELGGSVEMGSLADAMAAARKRIGGD